MKQTSLSALLVAAYVAVAPCATAGSWALSCGTTGYESGVAVAVLPDGDVAIAGRTSTNPDPVNSSDYLVARFDSTGAPRWVRSYAGALDDRGQVIVALSDGSLLVCGHSWSWSRGYLDPWLLGLTPTGDVAWEHVIGMDSDDGLGSGARLANDDVLLVGVTGSPGGLHGVDGWIVRVDPQGRTRQSTFGGDGNDGLQHVVGTTDGGAILIGTSDLGGPPAIGGDVVVALDASGDLTWQRRLTPALGAVTHIALTQDGGLLITGYKALMPATPWKAFVIRLEPGGDVRWAKLLISADSVQAYSVAENAAGHALVAGNSRDGSWLVALDASGSLVRQQDFDAGQPVDMALTPDGALYLAGSIHSGITTGNDAWLERIEDNWSLAPCALPQRPALDVVSFDVASDPITLHLARPTGNPTQTNAVFTPLDVTIGAPCGVDCSPAGPAEVSGPPWSAPLRVRLYGTLNWEDARAICETYGVHRGHMSALAAGDRGTCIASSLTTAIYRDDEMPGLASGWFYLVAASGPTGEGPLGTDSFGQPRIATSPCP